MLVRLILTNCIKINPKENVPFLNSHANLSFILLVKSVHDTDVDGLTAKVNDLPKMVSASVADSIKSKRTLRHLKEPNKRKIGKWKAPT